jgi:hypothetical protein
MPLPERDLDIAAKLGGTIPWEQYGERMMKG